MKLEESCPFPVLEIFAQHSPAEVCKNGYEKDLSSFCQKRIGRDSKCIDHYEKLAKKTSDSWCECPYGFSSYVFHLNERKLAMTGLIPFPRINSSNEKKRVKDSSEQQVSTAAVELHAKKMKDVDKLIKDKVAEDTLNNLSALHEIRKYNRNVKQSLERLCRDQSPSDPDLANAEIVKVWKLSELMSFQFEVLSLIADESLAKLSPKTNSEIYKVFDKCQRIYKSVASEKNIGIRMLGDSPISLVSDKTFPIIPTVLIENAIKYAPKGSTIDIRISINDKNYFKVSVSNYLSPGVVLPSDLFKKGERGNQDSEGTGVGLFLAQMVAKQHGSEIKCSITPSENKIEFFFLMKAVRYENS